MIGLVMLLVLAFVCFLLARVGARWSLAGDAAGPGAADIDDMGVDER